MKANRLEVEQGISISKIWRWKKKQRPTHNAKKETRKCKTEMCLRNISFVAYYCIQFMLRSIPRNACKFNQNPMVAVFYLGHLEVWRRHHSIPLKQTSERWKITQNLNNTNADDEQATTHHSFSQFPIGSYWQESKHLSFLIKRLKRARAKSWG